MSNLLVGLTPCRSTEVEISFKVAEVEISFEAAALTLSLEHYFSHLRTRKENIK